MAFPHDGKKFQKGKCANPNGRPREQSITTILRKLLDKISPKEMQDSKLFQSYLIQEGGLTNAEAISVVLLYKAINKQDIKAITEILDRTEGKATQKTELTGAGGEKLIFEIKDAGSKPIIPIDGAEPK